jgi:hypothetical protein
LLQILGQSSETRSLVLEKVFTLILSCDTQSSQLTLVSSSQIDRIPAELVIAASWPLTRVRLQDVVMADHGSCITKANRRRLP